LQYSISVGAVPSVRWRSVIPSVDISWRISFLERCRIWKWLFRYDPDVI